MCITVSHQSHACIFLVLVMVQPLGILIYKTTVQDDCVKFLFWQNELLLVETAEKCVEPRVKRKCGDYLGVCAMLCNSCHILGMGCCSPRGF